jgi:sugar (pentulose or hexulose) kinase
MRTIAEIVHKAYRFGLAIPAWVGCGVFPTLEAGVEIMVQLDRIFDPEPKKQGLYNEHFAKYQHLWPLMADYLRDLAA